MRRSVLLFGLVCLAILTPLVWSGFAAQPTNPTAVQSVRWSQSAIDDWNNGVLEGLIVSNNADGELRLDRDTTQGRYTSSGFEAPFTFSAGVLEWKINQPATTALTIEVRTSPNGNEWRDWRVVTLEPIRSVPVQLYGPLAAEAESRWLQYRITFTTNAQPVVPVVEEASWTLFDASAGPTLRDQPSRAPAFSASATRSRAPLVITRPNWGASSVPPAFDSMRPQRFEVTGLDMAGEIDPPTFIRTLQAIALQFSQQDLPYAYVIDSSGNVYQGRLGLAAGGTIGIGLLGSPTEASTIALAQTLAWLAESYQLPLVVAVDGTLGTADALALQTAADEAAVRSRWTFVESNTRDYTERLMLYNPTKQTAIAKLVFLPGQANAVQRDYRIAPGQRINIIANDIFSDTAVLPVEVTANRQIVAERTMLFGNDALGEPGIEQFARSWYFAEGDGSGNRATTLTLYNPQPSEVLAKILLTSSDGVTSTQSLVLEPFSSSALPVSAEIKTSFGMQVVASAPIAAERIVLTGETRGGGFLTHGAPAPSHTWYFAEGATIAPFVTTLALLNPGPVAAAITTTFLTESGTTYVRRYQIPAASRFTIDMQDIVPSPQGVGTVVSASQPIVAERTTYFNAGQSGTNTLGATQLAYTWHFAEGRTADPATEFILLANPNSKPAEITLRFGTENGEPKSATYKLPATGRIALLVNILLPFAQSHTTTVESTLPIVAERTILIANDGGGGGHTALGTPER